MSAALDAVTGLGADWTLALNAASVAWVLVAVALMVLGEFQSGSARKARLVLAPVAVLLAMAFAVKLASVFGPMLGFGSA